MESKTLKQLSTLTDVYNRLVETEEICVVASQQIKQDFADPDNCGEWFVNPIGYTVVLEKPIEDARKSFTSFVVGQLNRDYKNLRIDDNAANEYTRVHGFNAENLIEFIRERYADEDGATMQQIRTALNDLLPYHRGERAKTTDGLKRIGDNGFELRIHGYECEQRVKAEAFLKFVDIVLRGIAPSKVDTTSVRIGEVYKDDKVKSLRYFKNNALKVIFRTADDCERVLTAMFTE